MRSVIAIHHRKFRLKYSKNLNFKKKKKLNADTNTQRKQKSNRKENGESAGDVLKTTRHKHDQHLFICGKNKL